MKLLANALIKFISGFLLVAALLFLPAGTWAYPNAWLFIALLFIPMLTLGVWLYLKAPELLKKRVGGREKERTQKAVVAVSGLAFVLSFVLCALDFRFGWTELPDWLVVSSAVIQLASYGLYAAVMKQNAYLSRTVEIQQGQKLVDTGLYGIVRHPMYTATVLMFLAMPLVLGSWIGFGIMLVYPAVIVSRIKNEEKVLSDGLEGYEEYKLKVRYRLLPFIW
ncbi:MAG: isoprenylcysteine carboxylmethyltransferase family protein [Oscillospiraceae bacterium]|nr:isoprenylcysteine carboxylmethyltransferase family protein [Oscillospiraceae bacterium]